MAEPRTGGLGIDELSLATRNHGMPLEALQLDRTPVGMHYVLTHYDMPAVDAASWRLGVSGRVAEPVELTLDELRSLPRHTVRVTLECAGNGRAALTPRPVSQPWLDGAVGTADWTGARLADVLARAVPDPDAVDVVLTGHDHGVERRKHAKGGVHARRTAAMAPVSRRPLAGEEEAEAGAAGQTRAAERQTFLPADRRDQHFRANSHWRAACPS